MFVKITKAIMYVLKSKVRLGLFMLGISDILLSYIFFSITGINNGVFLYGTRPVNIRRYRKIAVNTKINYVFLNSKRKYKTQFVYVFIN